MNETKNEGIIVGGSFGDNREYVDFIRNECNNSKYVEYRGEVSFDEKIELLRNARALISPLVTYCNRGLGSEMWWEPFGLHFIESLALGTPVITSYNGASPEIIKSGKHGFLCSGKADYIEAINNVDSINRLDCVVRSYDFDRHKKVKEYLNIYKEVIG